ncbi:MAG: nuclear transport factor 2 family protein [Armatimonadetes bacterium]|nr:nuclear transport factor 2 family protein [Armatimonadota bacterium]
MSNLRLPDLIDRFFAAKAGSSTEDMLALFASTATVWDKGEDLELGGIDAIRKWMTDTVSSYNLTTEPESIEEGDGRQVVRAIVSGDFPGSPYAFEYGFLLDGGKITELVIDPIGPVNA